AALGAGGEIDGVLLQRLALVLGGFGLHALAAAQLVDRRLQASPVGAGGLERTAELAALLQRGQHEQLGGDEGIAALLGELIGDRSEERRVGKDGGDRE